MQLTGFHHLTAVTAEAARNHAFYTQTLGLRLVKKTVNQDDVSAYHLFYADGLASPGIVGVVDPIPERSQKSHNLHLERGLGGHRGIRQSLRVGHEFHRLGSCGSVSAARRAR